MSKINVPNAIRYLYPATVESVGFGTITAGGRVLRTIGNVQVRPGDRIWTDGRVAYGHTPPREQVNLPAAFSGVPFIGLPWGADNWYQGYYTDRAIRKPKHIGPMTTSSFLVNNGRSLFLEKTAPGRAVVDAEILSNDKGAPIGYSIATVREGEQICSANNSEILIENSLGTRSETIAIKDNIFVNAAVSDFVKIAGTDNYEFGGLFSSQYLYFRFTDEKGNWELLVGVSVRGLSICHTVPQSVGRPLFHTYSTLSRDIISREPFIGATDIVSCYETVTLSGEQTGQEKPSGSTEYWESVERLFAAVKLDSSGRVTIVHRNYYKEVGGYYTTTGWEPEVVSYDVSEDAGTFIGPGSAGPVGVPFEEHFNDFTNHGGSYSYYVRYATPRDDEDITGAPQAGFASGLNGITTRTFYNAISQVTRFPSVYELNDLSTALPDGFSATLKARNGTDYGALSIAQGSNRVIDDYRWHGECRLDTRYGLVHGGTELLYWVFPHISCYKFPNSPKTLAADFGDRLLMCQNGQCEYLDTHIANTRLRRMRRIVRIPASKLEPGQNIN